ncbi:MAG: hypothetical protein WB699_07575 [Bacteroidota bacterium]
MLTLGIWFAAAFLYVMHTVRLAVLIRHSESLHPQPSAQEEDFLNHLPLRNESLSPRKGMADQDESHPTHRWTHRNIEGHDANRS